MSYADMVVVPRRTVRAVAELIREEISRLKSELEAVEAEIRLFEERYGVSSSVLLEMLEGGREWALPEGSEPDIVEWEALIRLRDKIREKIERLEKLWLQLQGLSRYYKSSRRDWLAESA